MTPQPGAAAADPHAEGPLGRVLALIRHLRVHCPWDAEQTAASLLPHLLEEAHEVADAVRGDAPPEALASELGDLLLNVAYQIVLAEEAGRFDANAVADALERKMVRRHPHVDWQTFSPRLAEMASSEGPSLGSGHPESHEAGSGHPASPPAWERRKARERQPGASVLEGLARGLEPLARAQRVQERVAAVGFDWDDLDGPADKVAEELAEAREALARRGRAPGARDAAEEEVGDLLFAVVNLARRAGVHSATALAAANAKFERRFRALEAALAGEGRDAGELSLAELDARWERVKDAERKG